MNFIDQDIQEYAEQHTTAESALLQKLNRNTFAKVLQPRMLSGHMQGQFLSMISQMIVPKFILELGTYTGYSAMCLAEGLQPEGELHTIEINEELKTFAQQYFEESPYGQKIKMHIGDAIKIIPQLNLMFDLVFIDADKENYVNYYKLCKPFLNKGGYIIADNVLWSGNVVKHATERDADTEHLMAFNTMVQNDLEVKNVLLPIRDGLMLIRKL